MGVIFYCYILLKIVEQIFNEEKDVLFQMP